MSRCAPPPPSPQPLSSPKFPKRITERTVLTSGALDFLLDSAHQGSVRIETPQLTLPYITPDGSHFRTEGWV